MTEEIFDEDIESLDNRYFLEEEIGRGGVSTVYKAKDMYSEYFNDDSQIVIKIPNKKLLEKKDVSAFVYSEYLFLRKLHNENIVRILNFAIDKKTNIPFIVLEYIEGKILNDYSILEIDLSFKKHIFKTLFKTIDYIHSKDIIHADITPSNIIISKKDPMIIDFGISQNINDEKALSLELSKIKAFNPKYSAPEILEGQRPSIQSDIFSFACVMYEIFTCTSAFKENSLELKSKKNKQINLRKIPILLKPWFKKALSLNPEERTMKYPILFK